MNMTCAIVDDEPLALGLLESYVKKTPGLSLGGKYSSAVEAATGLQVHPVDLLFLDIQMPDLNGLDLSKIIDTSRTKIVFTTAFPQYALEGYKVNALDYLLKPISYSDFVSAVSRAQRWYDLREAQREKNEPESTGEPLTGYLFVKSDYKIIRVNFADILYVEGLKDYVKIYLASSHKPILSLSTMGSMEAALPASGFFRVHRSFIVNMSRVNVMERGQIVFGDKHLPVSDSYKDKVQDFINRNLLQGR